MLRRPLPLLLSLLFLTSFARAGEPSRAELSAAEAEQAFSLEGQASPVADPEARGGVALATTGPTSLQFRLQIPADGVVRPWIRVRAQAEAECIASLEGAAGPAARTAAGGWAWISPPKTAWQAKAGERSFAVRFSGPVLLDRVLLVRSTSWEPKGQGPAGTPPPPRAIALDDAFQRENGDPGPWQPASGNWEITKFQPEIDPQRASNAFVLIGRGEPAVTVAGDPLWREYAAEISACSVGASGRFGLVFAWQDPRNHCRAVFAAGEGEEALLIRVRDGAEEILARRPGLLRRRQYYRLRVECGREGAVVLIDGHEIFRAAGIPTVGRFGLWSEGQGGAQFDDALVRSLRRYRWSPGAGADDWSGEGEFAEAEQTLLSAGSARSLRTRLAGRSDWGDGAVEAEVSAPDGTAAGLAFAVRDAGGFVLWRTGSADGATYMLKPLHGRPDPRGDDLRRIERKEKPGAHRLLLRAHRGLLTAEVDGEPIGEWFVGEAAACGRAGVAAIGPGAKFAALEARFDPPPPRAVAANPVFEADSYMKDWASIAGEWRFDEAKASAWNRRDFFGHPEIGYDLEAVPAAGQVLDLLLQGDGETADSGYRLRIEAGKAQDAVRLALFRAGKEIEAKEAALASHDPEADAGLPGSERHGQAIRARLSLARRGGFVVALQDRREFLAWRDPEPLSGTRCGVATQGLPLDPRRLRVSSDLFKNDTFTAAPVDWRRVQGDWRMKNRFWCAPQWSWYGGRSRECAAIWHKDGFPGDFVFDLYASMQMDINGPPHYSRPGFQNLTVCGDGSDLSSGYSVVYGAEGGRATLLLRGSTVVARADGPAARAPQTQDGFPPMEQLHRRWWHWRCERRGARLRVDLDGETLFDYADPEPLKGDRIALWTERRGIMISRARLSFDRAGEREFPLVPAPEPGLPEPKEVPPAPGGEEYAEDFEGSRGAWVATGRENSARSRRFAREGGGAELRMINEVGGGDFGVRCLLPQPIDLSRHPWLSFDLRLDEGVGIDLLARCAGEWFSVRLTGAGGDFSSDILPDLPAGAAIGEGTRLVREVAVVRLEGRGWQRVEVPLGACVARLLRRSPAPLTELFLGNARTDELTQSGFGANRTGSSYAIDNVRIFSVPPRGVPAPEAVPVGSDGVARLRIPTPPGSPWIDAERLVLAAGDVSWSGPALAAALDERPDEGSLRIDLARLGLPRPPGGEIVLRLGKLAWQGGEEGAAELRLPVAPAVPALPRLLRVELPGQPAAERRDFLLPVPVASDSQTSMTWTPEGAPDDPGALRLLALRTGSNLRVPDPAGPMPPADLRSFPVLSLRYRAAPETRLDLAAMIGGQFRGFSFLNRGEGLPGPRMPSAPGEADGRWHSAFFEFGRGACLDGVGMADLSAQGIALQDFGWPGIPDGTSFWLDSVQWHPFLRPEADGGVKAVLRAGGWAEVAKFRHALLPLGAPAPEFGADAPPPGVVETPATANAAELRLLPPAAGAYVLHWAAGNASGWTGGEPAAIVVDRGAPELDALSPAEGEKAAPGALTARLRDPGIGIRPGSVRLRLGDHEFNAGPGSLFRYSPADGGLVARLDELPRKARHAFADDGEEIVCVLEALDLAGNALKREWRWTFAYAADKEAPPTPRVAWTPAEGYFIDPPGLPDGKIRLKPVPGEASIRSIMDEEINRLVVQIDPEGPRSGAVRLPFDKPVDLREGLMLRGAWRGEGRFAGDFRFRVGETWYAARFLHADLRGARVFAAIPGVRRDGGWHNFSLDVAEPLLAALPPGTEPLVREVQFGCPGDHAGRGGWLRFDGLSLFSRAHAASGVTARWQPVRDSSGVEYAAALDEAAETRPGAGYAADLREITVKPGPASFLHVAARDGAGNLSVAHLPLSPDAIEKPEAPPAVADLAAWREGGLDAEIFAGTDLQHRLLARIDPGVDFQWGDGPPAEGLPVDNFSVRWRGVLVAPETGAYLIQTVSDDGVRLRIGGQLLIENWTSHPPTEDSTTVWLEAGSGYELRLEMFEGGGGGMARLLWARPGGEIEPIPAGALRHRAAEAK